MNNKDNRIDNLELEYQDLIIEIKKELPNIVLPSMGRLDDSGYIDINGKNFVMSKGNEEV